jgi:hypothetical protein
VPQVADEALASVRVDIAFGPAIAVCELLEPFVEAGLAATLSAVSLALQLLLERLREARVDLIRASAHFAGRPLDPVPVVRNSGRTPEHPEDALVPLLRPPPSVT